MTVFQIYIYISEMFLADKKQVIENFLEEFSNPKHNSFLVYITSWSEKYEFCQNHQEFIICKGTLVVKGQII